jgi:flagellar protein FliJ
MDRFDFNLQKVLDYKVTVEDKKKEEFVSALRESLHQEKVLKDLIFQKEKALGMVSGLKTIVEYQGYTRYMDLMQKKVENQKENVGKAQRHLKSRKEELLKSTSDRKALEMLKDKAKTEFDLETSYKEQRLNDDFALFAYMRSERR